MAWGVQTCDNMMGPIGNHRLSRLHTQVIIFPTGLAKNQCIMSFSSYPNVYLIVLMLLKIAHLYIFVASLPLSYLLANICHDAGWVTGHFT